MRGIGLICSTLSAALMLAPPAAAAPLTPQEQAQAFADCAGRMTALTEHQWMFDGPASEATARRRDQFADLLDALAPDLGPQSAARIMEWRVAARAAQRTLLDLSAFSADPRQRQRADALAKGYVTTCDRLIVGT
jgi:hypothetical protein